MRYLDSGSREADQAAAHWLEAELADEIVELRWQTGYFAADALGLFAPTLQQLANENFVSRVLVGSNDGSALQSDVLQLVELLRLPRTNAALGVVRYGNAFFHPKTYHLRRKDGTQCAYVGSANLTQPGLGSLNVEAGIVLDTRDGGPTAVLDRIASAVDEWFAINRTGLRTVANAADVDILLGEGIVALTLPSRPPSPPTPPDT